MHRAESNELSVTEEMSLEQRVLRLEDTREIEQLMGRRAYLHAAGMHERELDECWAREAEDIAFEPEDWGVWEGQEAIRQCYVKDSPPVVPGLLVEHCLTTAVIEVAADRGTAKGVWISPGHETFPPQALGADDGEGEPGRPIAHWSWGRYGVDFVREASGWKIWHLHVYTTFRTPYDRDWVEASIERPSHLPPAGETLPGMRPPDRPVTFNQPYAVDAVPVLQPRPPLPYRTFDETWSYTDD